MLYLLGGIATALTVAMFLSREQLLGFPCVIFWAILGGYCYGLSAAMWDIYYFVFIASTIGMTVFCALGMYALHRSKKLETTGVEEMGDEGKYVDEESASDSSLDDFLEETPSRRVTSVQDRAKRRSASARSGGGRHKVNYGEFR